ncbi:hypothetical protein L1887_31992 [Cichorium endivia]|nr:hypothetical protein L1887_31992 [Cichorium endivia]
MVLGLKMKNRKSLYIQLDYIVNILEIKPWPPSQSLKSLRSALIQWKHGDAHSGSTKPVAPSVVSSSIEFNEAFRVHVTLSRDTSTKVGENETFMRNCIEFNMYEPRRDKTVTGKLLASGVIDFAEYGIVEESLMISVPMNCKRTFGNSDKPILSVKIQTVEKNHGVRLIDKKRFESVSALMNEEYAEEADDANGSSMAASFESNGNATPQTETQYVSLKPSKLSIGDMNASQIIGDFGSDADGLKNVKPLVSPSDSEFTKILEKFKNVGDLDQNCGRKESKVQQLQQRIQILEGELREAAGIEFSLYSVVAEHGSSVNKFHIPARRLSRLYLHGSTRASSGRSIVSGLILVAKACGNDVPRLTFWLSNSVALRSIINKETVFENDSNSTETSSHLHTSSDLEKVESWIFSRIIESIWWQTLVPYMQSSDVNSKFVESGYSLELWKSAFMDAYKRICPVRAAGYDCCCLHVVSKMITERLTARLDVAMFNAILRGPTDSGPVEPVSDPISDSRVLPVPSGKLSFGAGAQLKKTIGNWSRWLTDLFPIDIDNDSNTSFNSFHLLNSLSDLLMLPKDLLLSNTIRKEVCPNFSVPLIKTILDNFVPDEFCPDPIPEVVLEALNSEELIESGENCVASLPCATPRTIYHPPASRCFLEGSRSRGYGVSSILRKSNTSDDELDELDSPLNYIIDSSWRLSASIKPVWSLKDVGSCNTVRYQLLRDVWMNSE